MIQRGQHLPREHYRSMPWRNGSGVTLEIAREPATGGEFLWRLSLASVATSGAFSNYAGYQRCVTLVAGAGFRLAIGVQAPVVLDAVGASAFFPGDAPTHCVLIDGACNDLSLMVREPGAIISVTRIQAGARRVVPLLAGARAAVFCLSGDTLLTAASEPAADGPAHTEIKLAMHDTVIMGLQTAALSLRPSSSTPLDLLLLTWKTASAGPP
jgi:environmental stress-induced protein Ves